MVDKYIYVLVSVLCTSLIVSPLYIMLCLFYCGRFLRRCKKFCE